MSSVLPLKCRTSRSRTLERLGKGYQLAAPKNIPICDFALRWPVGSEDGFENGRDVARPDARAAVAAWTGAALVRALEVEGRHVAGESGAQQPLRPRPDQLGRVALEGQLEQLPRHEGKAPSHAQGARQLPLHAEKALALEKHGEVGHRPVVAGPLAAAVAKPFAIFGAKLGSDERRQLGRPGQGRAPQRATQAVDEPAADVGQPGGK